MSDPKNRYMVFVDGTNILNWLGRVELAAHDGSTRSLGWRLDQHRPAPQACELVRALLKRAPAKLGATYRVLTWVRWHWFGSYEGGDRSRSDYFAAAKSHEFMPYLLRKRSNGEKGVDMALAIELLANSSARNFDVALLLAGDGDYAPLVREARRHGQRIVGLYSKARINPDLSAELDAVIDADALVNTAELADMRTALIDECLNRTQHRRAKGPIRDDLLNALEALRIARLGEASGLQEAVANAETALSVFLAQDSPPDVSLSIS